MESQFAHIEGYGRRPSKRKKDGRSMYGIVNEAERRPGYCNHVSAPKPAKILYGCTPSEAVRIAADRAKQAVDADGRRLRIDALVFLGGVASWPVKWDKIRKDKAEEERLRKWLRYLIGHLREQYGVLLHYILLHVDEAYPHVHWACVPPLGPDRRMRISSAHPGRAAYEKARAAGGSNLAGRQAYKAAMRKWLDDFHIAVYASLEIARVGPRRQRLSQREHKARQQADAAIRAEIVGEFSKEIEHWKRLSVAQQAQLAAGAKDLAELQARIAHLEAQFPSPPKRSP